MWHESNLVRWRLRKPHQLHSSSVHMHLLLWDVSLIHRALEIALHGMADNTSQLWEANLDNHLCLESIWTDPSLLSSWCFHLHAEWCPSAAADRSCSVWKWASWWWSWWPVAQDRSRTAGLQGRPATVDLTCTLFWTSKCSDLHWNTVEGSVHDSQKAAVSPNKHVHKKKKAYCAAFAWKKMTGTDAFEH